MLLADKPMAMKTLNSLSEGKNNFSTLSMSLRKKSYNLPVKQSEKLYKTSTYQGSNANPQLTKSEQKVHLRTYQVIDKKNTIGLFFSPATCFR